MQSIVLSHASAPNWALSWPLPQVANDPAAPSKDVKLLDLMKGAEARRLFQLKQQNDKISVSAVWMTEEDGVEEKREERDVRRVAEKAGVDFRVWIDEKYFIDEYD